MPIAGTLQGITNILNYQPRDLGLRIGKATKLTPEEIARLKKEIEERGPAEDVNITLPGQGTDPIGRPLPAPPLPPILSGQERFDVEQQGKKKLQASEMLKELKNIIPGNDLPDLSKKITETLPEKEKPREVIGRRGMLDEPIYAPEAIKPTTKNFQKGEEALIEEAKKYKSAEEFVKAQGKTFYHGTKAPIKDLTEADPSQFGKVSAIYGEGLYLTDSPEVAKSYAQNKGAGEGGKVHEAIVNVKDEELLNLDQDLPQDAVHMFNEIKQQYSDEPFTSAKGYLIYEELREDMADNDVYGSEAVEIFQNINSQLWEMGYKGLKHTGGMKTKNPIKHNVIILFQDPYALKMEGLKTKAQLTDIWNKAKGKQ